MAGTDTRLRLLGIIEAEAEAKEATDDLERIARIGDVRHGMINLLYSYQDIPREWLREFEGAELEALLADVAAKTMGE